MTSKKIAAAQRLKFALAALLLGANVSGCGNSNEATFPEHTPVRPPGNPMSASQGDAPEVVPVAPQ